MAPRLRHPRVAAGIVPQRRRRIVDRAFALALAIKGIDGALELIGGLVLFVVPPSAITLVFRSLTQHELSEDPHDFIAIHVRAAAEQLAGSASVRGFGVLYLIGHGVIKLVLVGAMFRRIRPAYPVAIVFLGSFILYELYRSVLGHSIALLLFAALDTGITTMVVREYLELRRD
ncbi:MAG: DUF2127 domain-containing protein [Candidatus Rokuibacteriota bacterium]|nr:MAG: DUF2127 domain-containing protein [Candidatus Rokubacteria bacterium]